VKHYDARVRLVERRAFVFRLQINDLAPKGYLSFDLRDVLSSLGPEALDWYWVVSAVQENGEELWATGTGWPELEGLDASGARVPGSQLAEISGRIHQVIWGEFTAFRDCQSETPWVRIVAWDSSWYEVWCEDEATLTRVGSAFSDTSLEVA